MKTYDVALSFAGEDREHAKALADLLKAGGYDPFYDENELANLWGKNLYDYLSSVYKDRARYCVMFLSKYYERKLWTNHERQMAQARAFEENREYILPVRLDDTEIPGIPPTIGYLDLRSMTVEEVYEVLVKKLPSTASRKTPSDDNNAPHPESGKEKSFHHERDQNVNPEDSKTSLGQKGISKNASNKPLKVFITYSHKDTKIKDKLITRLAVMKREGLIEIWHDNEILGGDKWREEIFSTNLPNSDLLLYLVSAESLASENCNKELAIALDGKIRIIPIILEDCDWKNDRLSDLQAFPERGKPINEWNPESKGWQSVIDGIRKVANEMQSQSQPSPTIAPEELEILAFLGSQKGSFLMMLKQFDRAIAAYSRAIELNPKKAEIYNNRGIAYYDKGEYNLAIQDYCKAIQLKPDYPEAYMNLGNAYGTKGDFDRALVNLDKAMQLKDNFAEAYNNRGALYVKNGHNDLAITNFNTAIQLKSDYAEAYNNRGAFYGNAGEIDLAIKDYTKAIKHKPKYADAYYNRGVDYKIKGEYDLAIDDFDAAIQLNFANAEVYYNRGTAFSKKGEVESAIKDYNEVIQLKPDHAEAYLGRGAAYHEQGEYDQAIDDYTKAISIKDEYTEAYICRGLAYHRKNKFDLAIVDYNNAMRINSKSAEAYHNRGNAYHGKGEYDLSIKDYTKAIELKPDDAMVYFNRGITYQKMNKADLAIKDFTKVIQLKPNDAEAYNCRGMACGKEGGVEHALRDFTKAIEIKPDHAEAYTNRGILWLQLQAWEYFKFDLTTARNVGVDIAAGFRNAFGSVANFERITGIRLPEDIAVILTPPQK